MSILRLLTIMVVVRILLSGTLLSAQQQIEPTFLTVTDGLASSNVTDVIQDSYGLLWIATVNGLQKYDGFRFETFKNSPARPSSLQSNNVWGLKEDAKHNIWVGTEMGASRFDRKKNEFVNYDFSKIFKLGDVSGRVFRFFLDSQNRLWACTRDKQLVYYEPSSDTWKQATYDLGKGVKTVHEGHCLAVAEDNKGGLWMGSISHGLMYRKKGEQAFKPVFPQTVWDANGPAGAITALFSGADNILWMTTRDGVLKYDPVKKTLKTIIKYTDSMEEEWNQWNRIIADHQGNIWVANNFRGILKFKGISDDFEEVTVAGKLKMKGHGWNITMTNFIVDRSGIFWMGTQQNGLLKYDPVSKPFTVFTYDNANPQSMSPNGAFGVLSSKVRPGFVYVGTRGGWLNVLDTKKNTFSKYTYKLEDDRFGGSVRSIAENKDGSLLLGTWGDGIIQTDRNYQEIKRYKYQSNVSASISDNAVRVIKPDKAGRFWVGSDNGLNIFDPQTQAFRRILSNQTRKYPAGLLKEVERLVKTDQKVAAIEKAGNLHNSSAPLNITSEGSYLVVTVGEGDPGGRADYGWIQGTKKDTLWQMGDFNQTYFAGGAAKNRIHIEQLRLQPGAYQLHYSSDDSHSFGKWNEQPPDETSLYGIVVIRLTDQDQAVTRSLLQQKQREFFISGTSIKDIEVGSKYIWVAVLGNGFDRIDPSDYKVKHYHSKPGDVNTLSNDNINDMFEDSQGIIWLATEEGVNRFDPVNEKFTRYLEEDGLPTNIIMGIQQGEKDEIWVYTENGISRMVSNAALDKVTFINYNSLDGLGGNTFTPLVADRGPDGQYYFGGDHGLTTFGSISANNTPPSIILSNLLISNKSVFDMKEDSPLKGSLMETKKIELAYDQNNLSFEFAALHYANSPKNQYAHMLKGYDKDWIYDNRNFATYTNLDPGTYEFMIRASNAYGVWNEEGKTLYVTILPPWWKTWWAYAAYFTLIGLIGYTGSRILQTRIKQQERERSREKELQQAKEIEKAYTELKATQNQLIQSEKMASLGELTAGIAHEIQNPLNFVNNFSEINKELLAEMNEEIAKGNYEEVKLIAKDVTDNEDKIAHHGKRADAIVKGMLQHSGNSSGQKEPTDINALCDEYLRLSYHGLRAKDKSFNATLKTDFDKSIGKINIVPQDLGRVILNLLNNAFYVVSEKKRDWKGSEVKYDPTVSLSTRKLGDKIEIIIGDNGNGIPEKVLDKIFQPFFTTKPTGQGTGLGLSLSYDIVTKGHGGELKVDTEESKGSTFIIRLPV